MHSKKSFLPCCLTLFIILGCNRDILQSERASSSIQGSASNLNARWGKYRVGYLVENEAISYVVEDRSRKLDSIVYYPSGIEGETDEKPAILEQTRAKDNRPPSPSFYSHEKAEILPELENLKFPVILASHGDGGSKQMYKFLLEFLASHGYICLAIDHKGNDGLKNAAFSGNMEKNMTLKRLLDLSAAIDHIKKWMEHGKMPYHMADSSRIGLVGHSYGGHIVLGFAGGYDLYGIRENCINLKTGYPCDLMGLDPASLPWAENLKSVKAVISMAHDATPEHLGKDCEKARNLDLKGLLYIGGTRDWISPVDRNIRPCNPFMGKIDASVNTNDGEIRDVSLNRNGRELIISGADHLGFSDFGNRRIPQNIDDKTQEQIDPETLLRESSKIHDLVRNHVKAVFDRNLKM
ncbi:MAG: alpha/beta fold hydrolase [Oligoflexales bacterium]|nr:alpha/beta fold hydrolase [Oligoflexales bacterium]